jgi:hypothetical protein
LAAAVGEGIRNADNSETKEQQHIEENSPKYVPANLSKIPIDENHT